MKTKNDFSSSLRWLTGGAALSSAAIFLLGANAPAQSAPGADAGDQRVAAELTRVLRARITSPSGVKITVKPTDRSSEGYFAQVAMASKNAKIKKLPLSELTLDARNVRIDVPYLRRENGIRTLAATTNFRAVVSENDLTNLLAQGKSTKDMKLRVKYLPDGRMRVSGQLNYTLVNGPVQGIGRLVLKPGSKVNLEIQSLKLRGAEVPGFIKDQLSSRINPVIDYADVPFKPRFRSLKVVGTRAILSSS